MAPLVADKQQWEAQFTDEEKQAGAVFEQKLKDDPQELAAFMQEIQETFTSCDTNEDGLLNREEFKTFVVRMD